MRIHIRVGGRYFGTYVLSLMFDLPNIFVSILNIRFCGV